MSADAKRLAEIKARCEAATPGPWVMRRPHDEDEDHEHIDGPDGSPIAMGHVGEDIGADAEFIANAREDVPFLLAKLEEAERKSATAETAADGFANMHHEALRMLAASEAAAGQMRAALEKIVNDAEPGEDAQLRPAGYNVACAALATDAGRGWLSPEEAERLRKELEQARNDVSQEEAIHTAFEDVFEVLDPVHGEKDWGLPWANEETRAHLALVAQKVQQIIEKADVRPFVSEEESDRRCREVAEQLRVALCHEIDSGWVNAVFVEQLAVIIERVKGGAR